MPESPNTLQKFNAPNNMFVTVVIITILKIKQFKEFK